jgi:hypothetical protein
MNPPTTDPLTVKDENATTPSDIDAPTQPSTTGIPTTPEDSILITSSTTMNETATTTELLGKDIEHTTSSGQTMTTRVVPDKESDASIVIVDSKFTIVAIYLSASSLALFFALAVAMFVLVVVLLCKRKRKAKESESANIELTRVRELTTETMKSKQASNIYTSPTHNHYSSEGKLDLM